MRKVMIIAYRFPPQGGGGVQRTLKFVRYLREFGWSAVVHTVSNPHWRLRDESLLAEVPSEVPVYRTATFEFERLEDWLMSVLRPDRDAPPPALHGNGNGHGPEEKRGMWGSLHDLIHGRILMPDPQVAWLPGAWARSLYIARREGVDLIYTSSPPNSCHLLGRMVKRSLGIPWVADFRDPWTDGLRRREAYRDNPARERLEQSWETSTAAEADHILVTTEASAERFASRHPSAANKLSVLTNGFDEADFARHPEEQHLEPDRFHLTLTGSVETMFDARPLFEAIDRFVRRSDAHREALRVNLVGTRRGKYDRFLAERGLTDTVRYFPYVPHAESVQFLTESDALFLCQIPKPESAGVKLQAKLFEYLFAKKPILALTLPGATADVLRETGLGQIANPDDSTEIENAIGSLYEQWKSGAWTFQPNHEAILRFDRRALTERLAGIFVEVRERAAQSESPDDSR